MRIIYVLSTYCKALSEPAASDHLAPDLAVRRRRLRVIQDRSLSRRYLIGARVPNGRIRRRWPLWHRFSHKNRTQPRRACNFMIPKSWCAPAVFSIPIARSTSGHRWPMPANLISSLHPEARWYALASTGRGFTRSLVHVTGFGRSSPTIRPLTAVQSRPSADAPARSN
jgi:hypothetical protein